MRNTRQSVSDYFSDAPYFRRFQGTIGAKYHLREHPLGPGLWIADRTVTLEIVRRKEWDPFKESFSSREEALKNYVIEIVEIQPGDGVVNHFLRLEKTRRNTRDFLADFDRDDFYQNYHDAGALVHFHIPKNTLQSDYIYDETAKCYRTRPYQVKFAPENTILETDDGIEQIRKHNAVRLEKGRLSIQSVPIFSGSDERLVGGQPLLFYRNEAFEVLGEEPGLFEAISHIAPGEISMSTRLINGRLQFPNPYRTLKQQFQETAQLLKKACILTPEQKEEFAAHQDDIQRRFYYFEANPLKPV